LNEDRVIVNNECGSLRRGVRVLGDGNIDDVSDYIIDRDKILLLVESPMNWGSNSQSGSESEEDS
jgi:hypothetical protein